MLLRLAFAIVVCFTLCGLGVAQTDLGQTMSHSYGMEDDDVGPSVLCNPFYPTPPEGWARFFQPSRNGVTDDIEITEVRLGVNAFAGVGFDDQPIDINIYEYTGDEPDAIEFDDLEEIYSEEIMVADFDDSTVITVELATPVVIEEGVDFLVEVKKPDFDGGPTDRTFTIGANTMGQTGPSWYLTYDSGADPPNDCTDFLDEPIDTEAEVPAPGGDFYFADPINFMIEVRFQGGCVAPTDFRCEEDGDDILVSWISSGDYTTVEVLRDGEIVATLEDDEFDYLDEDVTGAPTYQLICSYDENDLLCSVETPPCKVGTTQECSEPDSVISDALDDTTDIIDVDADFEVGDIDVVIEISHTWIGDLSADLESPDGTSIGLFSSNSTARYENVDVVFDDDGVPYEVFLLPYGASMQPEGFGGLGGESLAAFNGEDVNGDWTLTIVDSTEPNEGILGVDDPPYGLTSHGSGTLDRWCIRANAAVDALFKRGDINSNGSVSPLTDSLYLLQWQFAGGPEPECRDAADVDGNNIVSALLDALYLLNYGFSSGPDPEQPFPDCGLDDDLDGDVDCVTPPPCT